MVSVIETGVWVAVAVVLSAFAIPWFLWGESRVVAGVPLWVWWHVAWMALASVAFRLFAEWAWGLGVQEVGE